MPLDPSISLSAAAPQPQQANPLGMLGGYLDVAGKMQALRSSQQVFMAKQKMGEMMATTPPLADGSPDWDSIQQKFMQDPTVAPFAPQAMNEIRQLHLTNTQIAGEEQKQNLTGIQSLIKAAAAGYNEPSQIGANIQTYLKSQPPEVQKRLGPAASQFVQSLTANLPDGPAGKALLQQRIIAQQLAAGVSPEVLAGLTGKPQVIDRGGSQDIVNMPSLGGMGAPTEMGSLPKGLAPQVVEGQDGLGRSRKVVVGGGAPGGILPPNSGLAGSGPAMAPAGQQPDAPSIAGPGPQVTDLGLTGPSLSDKELATKMGGDQADYIKRLNDDVSNGAKLNRVVQFARDALTHYTPGGGSTFKTQIAEAMQATGLFSQQQIDNVSNGSLAGAQQFAKDMNQAVFQIAEQSIPQGSRLSVEALKGATRSNPNQNLDVRAVDKVFSQFTQQYNQIADEQKTLNDFRRGTGDFKGQGAGDMSMWPQVWQGLAAKRGYVDTSVAQHVGNSQDYATANDVKAAYSSGKLTRDAAYKLLQDPKYGISK